MKKRYLPGQKISDRDAIRLAYRGKAIIERKIGKREADIQRNKQAIMEYVANGLKEEAEPLAEVVAKQEADKRRLLKRKLYYDRMIAVAESGGDGVDLRKIDKYLIRWAKQNRGSNRYADDLGELLDSLNQCEDLIREADFEIDQIQSEQGSYSERAKEIIEEMQAEVNARKRRAEQLKEEAMEELAETV